VEDFRMGKKDLVVFMMSKVLLIIHQVLLAFASTFPKKYSMNNPNVLFLIKYPTGNVSPLTNLENYSRGH
jgi:hypothetical protein